ncbi:hypothetical protein [Spirosoma montaniterrae]|uniref:hypothetical protein n=1 Tax=Spirosoma montaniterrae TaxID=1178516 RepID=UPI0012FA5989|nr:hypothetical protein [Spirosoma montaniterrae]
MIYSPEMEHSFRVPTIDTFSRYTKPVSVSFDEEVTATIWNLRQLTSNWDGYGADVIKSQVIDNTVSIFEALSYSHRYSIDKEDIIPSSHGTISLEWSNDRGDTFAVEVGKTTVSYFSPAYPELSSNPLPITSMWQRIDEINSALDLLFA